MFVILNEVKNLMNMKINNILLLTAAAGLVLASCGKLSGDSRVISIEAGIGSPTKSSAGPAAFPAGGQLSLYAWLGGATAVPSTLVVNGVTNTFDGTTWTPSAPMLWDDKSSAHYFLGISPARAVTNFKADPYTLDPANEAASDLLIATNLDGLTPSNIPVPLSFSHAMARLDVNLTFRNQWETNPTVVSVKVDAKKTATVDYLSRLFTVSGSTEAVPLMALTNDTWRGLQIPQSGVHVITVRIDDKDFVYTHNTDIPLAGGQYTTVNLNVGRDKIELSKTGITISDWIAGDTISGGEAQDD